MIGVAGMVTGTMEWWNARHGWTTNDSACLRMRTGMNRGMDEVLMASLDPEVCIYGLLQVDADENRQARQNERIRFYLGLTSGFTEDCREASEKK